MNLTSGIFTAPRSGLYFFTFSGMVHFTSGSQSYLWILLVLNGNDLGMSFVDRAGGYFESISLQSTPSLKMGDRVWLRIGDMRNAVLHDNHQHYTHFTGQILQEEFSHP